MAVVERCPLCGGRSVTRHLLFRGCSPLFSKTFILAYITQNVSIKQTLSRSIGPLWINWPLSKVGRGEAGGGGGGSKKKGQRKKRTDKQTKKQEHEIYARKLVRASNFPLFFKHFSIDD